MRLQAATQRQLRREEFKEKTRRTSILLTVFGASAIVVMVLGGIVGVMLVVRYYKEPEAVFEAVPKKTIKIPPKTPEHKMNVAKHEASKPKPTFTKKLLSTKPSEITLPDLPMVDLDHMVPLDPSELITDQVTSMMGSSGIGNGMGNGLLGGGGSGTGMSFMGMKSEGSRVLLIFDISTTVVNKANKAGIPFDRIKEETIKMVEGLTPNMRFGLIQFSRAFRPYPEQLMVATKGNKDKAITWINENWREDSLPRNLKGVITRNKDGPLEVLKHAFSMEPDMIFFISDASFQDNTGTTVDHSDIGNLLKELQEASGITGGVKFNFIGFGMDNDDESTMKRIVRRNGGKFRAIE